MALAQEHCEACRADASKVTDQEQQELLSNLSDWSVIERDGIKQLERLFTFKNFQDALNFTNQLGELAETANHHPTITLTWGKVTVAWWTHKIHGLHHNDFIMAARTEELPVIVKE